ncbi:MAG: tetratricopeptide repeat protein [Acidobacteria bacterium]|nr:tetratricopeptide repeat protein [Acidobacteriota bacterium]
MFRKRLYLILIFCLALPLGFTFAFAQNKQVDKNAVARFEKSIEQGKIEEIERALLNFAVANPNNPQVLELLAKVRYLQNRLSEATALYRRVLTLDANSASAKINLARILFVSGQADEAQRMLGDIAGDALFSQALRLNLATTFLLIGEPQKALEATEKLPLKIKNADALPIIAASYSALKSEQKLRDLLPLIKRAAASNPSLAARCAEVLQNAGLNKEAIILLRSTLAAAPNNFNVLVLLGRFEIGAKEFAPAKQHLNRAAKLQPRSARLFFAQALLEEAQENSLAALELLKQARQLAPDSPEILSQYVITAMRANQSRAAVEAAQILAESKPDEPEYLYLLGAASLQNGNISQAQRNLQRLFELHPTHSRGCLALGLTLAAQSNQLENARRQLLRCIEIDANNVEAKYQLGLSYKTQGETAKAIGYLEETVKLVPDYALALRDLGALYLQSSAERQARVVLEKAVALAPNDADTHFQLSRLYNLIGESVLAKKHLEMFQKLRSSGGNLR